MIGYLKGKPLVMGEHLLLLVGGVGYRVHVSGKIFAKVALEAETELFIYTHVREDVLELFGFTSSGDQQMFELLLSVSGVGPRTALHIMDYGAETIIQAVQNADVSIFSAVPRVGKKLAQKIIIDLKSKLGSVRDLKLGPSSPQEQEVIQALEALGFSSTDIYQALSGVDLTADLPTSELLKQAMKHLNRT